MSVLALALYYNAADILGSVCRYLDKDCRSTKTLLVMGLVHWT